jgi:thiamine biosynthesis lipoprotein
MSLRAGDQAEAGGEGSAVRLERRFIRHSFTCFGGSRCEIVAGDSDGADVSAAVAEVYSFESQLTRFSEGSELSRLNRSAGARTAVSPLLGALLRACLQAFAMSDGLVNAAVGSALVAAGYDRSIERLQPEDRDSPDVSQTAVASVPRGEGPPLHAVRPLPEVLEVGEGWARLAPGSALDLGGVGKGWLADRLAERFDDACVNLGGDLRAIGPGPDGEGWAVGLCDSRVVRIRDGGAATSGTRARRWAGGHHLVDPRTGLPSTHEVAAFSVVARDALTAEVLAKAAILIGPERAESWLTARGAAAWAAVR